MRCMILICLSDLFCCVACVWNNSLKDTHDVRPGMSDGTKCRFEKHIYLCPTACTVHVVRPNAAKFIHKREGEYIDILAVNMPDPLRVRPVWAITASG